MKRQTRILASTAISLLMAGEAFGASLASARQVPTTSGDMILAQAENPTEERQRKKHQGEGAHQGRAPADAGASEEQRPRRKQQAEEAPARKAPAAVEAPREQRPGRKQQAEEAPARRAPSEAEAPQEQRPRRKQQAEEAPARRAPAEAEAPQEQRPRRKQQAEEAPARRAPAEAEAQQEQRPRRKQQAEEAPAKRAPAEAEAQQEQRPPRKQQAEEAPAKKAPVEAEAPEEQRPRRKQQAEEVPAPRAPAEAEAPAEQRPPRKEQAGETPERRAPAEAEGQAEGVRPGRPQRAQQEQMPTEEPPVSVGSERQQGGAPVLDSQKRPGRSPQSGEQTREQNTERPAEAARPGEAEQPQRERQARRERPDRQIELPTDDDAAQAEIRRPVELAPVTREEGRRIRQRPENPIRERPRDARVVREIGDRVVIEVDDQVFVESNDRPRLARDAREVYYEELPRNRTREVIVRPDGTRVVTIRDRYGDVIRRSRIAPDDREYVLSYVEDEDYDRVRQWRDPGLDLPPMVLTIPAEEYILDAERVDDPDVYYTFLEQPPVERVERYYSVDEVKRSARIRDKTRRVDLDTITFDFGSSSIPESEITRLEGVAQAIEKLLQKNPAETFLIEGHTDAVGSDLANLALSDRRAEAVAEALSSVFAIPPENLATQGYGEQYLKVSTQAPERENRRVAIRRITPLVAPVASAE